MSASLYRTSNPKWVTYLGDGAGRDQYIIFNNGGLNELREYRGSQPNTFNLGPLPTHKGVTPVKEATAFDYTPDGSGRDSYIIRSFGLKRDYRSGYKEFERGLRSGSTTPIMDSRQQSRNYPFGNDSTRYSNWPSPKAVADNIRKAKVVRRSIERLTQSPTRQSPIGEYMNQTLNPTAFKKPSHTIDPVFATNQATDATLSKTLHGFYKDKNMGGNFYAKRMTVQPKAPTEGQLVADTDNQNIEHPKPAHQRGFSQLALQSSLQSKQQTPQRLHTALAAEKTPVQPMLVRRKLAQSSLGNQYTLSLPANHIPGQTERQTHIVRPQKFKTPFKRIPLGHNIQLDDIEDTKIVNKNRAEIWKSPTPLASATPLF